MGGNRQVWTKITMSISFCDLWKPSFQDAGARVEAYDLETERLNHFWISWKDPHRGA
jgi:hypothetical protein